MLNRRHLRIKVLQALYAYFQSENDDLARGEKELFFSIQKIWELYIRLLLLFREVRDAAERRIEEGKRKKLPKEEDLHPNRKFVDNRVLTLLADSQVLQVEREKTKLGWEERQDLVNRVFQSIRESEAYHTYMDSGQDSFRNDQKLLMELFREHIANSELLQAFFEENSIYWVDDLDLVSQMVIRTIDQLEVSSTDVTLLPLYRDEEEDPDYAAKLFRKSIHQHAENRELIAQKAENWEMERIALMDMLIMEMALTEVREIPEVPVKVTLNEFIEISKFYSTPKSNSFINGILDKTVTMLREEGKIKKIGRGLIE